MWRSFPAATGEIFHSKSGNGRTILSLCGKENSSNRSSGYVEGRIDKTDKIVFFGCSKMHHWESVNEKNIVLIKGRTFFVQNVSVDTWIAILSKLSESCHKTFIQELLQIRIWEKINNFSKAMFFQEWCTSGQMNCGFEHLTKTFFHFSGINFCINPKKYDFFKMNFLAVKIFHWRPWKFFFKISGRKIFARSSKKVL